MSVAGSRAAEYVERTCLFCGPRQELREVYPQTFSESDLSPELFSARRRSEHFHYAIVRCGRCGLVFSRRVLREECLQELYAASAVTFERYVAALRRDYWRVLEPHISGLPLGAALEIGCSSGFFLEELREHGCETVVGFEPSLEARARANASVRHAIVSAMFDGVSERRKGTFDLVASFQTLDHVSDPRAFLLRCHEALRPGGLLYLVTHDVDAWQARLLGESSPIIDIEHIYLFSPKTLRRLLAETGFDVVGSGSLANGYPVPYLLHMLPLPGWLRSAAGSAVRRLGLSEFGPRLWLGNMYAIGRRAARQEVDEAASSGRAGAADRLSSTARRPRRDITSFMRRTAVSLTSCSVSFLIVGLMFLAACGGKDAPKPGAAGEKPKLSAAAPEAVPVISSGLALGKKWVASSQIEVHPQSGTIDDQLRNTIFFHTKEEDNPWIEIDLEKPTPVSNVEVLNRSECCSERTVPLIVELSVDRKTWNEVARKDENFRYWKATFSAHDARYVRLKVARRSYLHLERIGVH